MAKQKKSETVATVTRGRRPSFPGQETRALLVHVPQETHDQIEAIRESRLAPEGEAEAVESRVNVLVAELVAQAFAGLGKRRKAS